jgi:hypothetical protein
MACALLLNDDRDDYGFFRGDKLDKKKHIRKRGKKEMRLKSHCTISALPCFVEKFSSLEIVYP